MQTFMPFPSFAQSARVLDRQRLGKQRVECLQITTALLSGSGAWYNHPATRMWVGYEIALVKYGLTVCKVWKDRGYRDTCFGKIRALISHVTMDEINNAPLPHWVGDPDFHTSHQSNLVRKKPEHYRPYFPDVPDNLEYIWPKGKS